MRHPVSLKSHFLFHSVSLSLASLLHSVLVLPRPVQLFHHYHCHRPLLLLFFTRLKSHLFHKFYPTVNIFGASLPNTENTKVLLTVHIKYQEILIVLVNNYRFLFRDIEYKVK